MLLGLLAGCDFFSAGPRWEDQLEPAGVCYAFDLDDGVGSNEEIHAIFGCLNRQGMLHAFERVDTAVDAPARGGTVGGALLAAVTAAAGAQEVEASSLLSGVLALFDDPEGTTELIELALEFAYGAAVDELGGIPINSSSSLRGGVLLPLSDSLGAAATTVLDGDLNALGPLSEALLAEDTPRWVWSFALAPEAPDRGLSGFTEDWTVTFAQLLEDTDERDNNRHPGATGNSLRDSLTLLTAGDTLPDLLAAAAPLLEDEHTRDALARWVEDEDDAARWDDLDNGVYYLSRVDRLGSTVDGTEDSALVSVVRLLHDANQPVDCSIDIFVTDIEWSLGNLSVALLEVIARLDPETAADGVDILGDALGYALTGAVLDTIADSGVCPVIDHQLVDDLESIDRLSDPAAEDLLRTLIGLLQATDDHTPELVDLIAAVHAAELVEPIEELVYDLAGTGAADHALAMLPALLDPDGRQASGSFPAGVEPVDVHAIGALLLALDHDRWSALAPPVRVVLAESTTWDAVDNLRTLLTRSGTVTERAWPMLAEAVKSSPDLPWLASLNRLVEDRTVMEPALALVEVAPLRAALLDTELLAEGPVPWLATLYTGGTLDQLWDTLALFRPLLGDADA